MYTYCTDDCTFGSDLYAQSVLSKKNSASELSRNLIKLVGHCRHVKPPKKNFSAGGQRHFHVLEVSIFLRPFSVPIFEILEDKKALPAPPFVGFAVSFSLSLSLGCGKSIKRGI